MFTERRSPNADYDPFGNRLWQAAEKAIKEHDDECRKLSPDEWMSEYSLLNHHIKVAQVMTRMGEVRNRNARDILIGKLAALLHDTGKLDREMRDYRRNRRLSLDEKVVVRRHDILSGRFVDELINQVRESDRVTIHEVAIVVRFHHKPARVSDPRLRAIAYDLKFADAFVAVQEDRDRPGAGLSQAVEFIEQLDICRENSENGQYPDLIASSKRVLCWLYGLNLDQPDV